MGVSSPNLQTALTAAALFIGNGETFEKAYNKLSQLLVINENPGETRERL